MELSLEADSLAVLATQLQLDTPDILKGYNRALRETLRFATRHVKQELRHLLPPDVIKRRLLSRFNWASKTLFLGTNPLPHDTLRGLKSALAEPKAFQVRLGKAKKPMAYQRSGTGRWNIKRIMSPWEGEGEYAVQNAYTQLEEYFYKRFEHHLYFKAGQG